MYVEAPTYYRPRPGDGPVVFLAGGISHCPDWQAEAAARFVAAMPRVVVLNPRRSRYDCDPSDRAAASQQIGWEFHHMHVADLVMFWFPPCDRSLTTQPITMLELGTMLGVQDRKLVVGVDEGYPREFDVLFQASLRRPGLVVHSSLDATVSAAVAALPGPRAACRA